MPYTIKTQQIAVKDPDTGEYSGVDVLAEQTTEGLLNEIEVKGTTVKNEVDGYIADARDDIDQLEIDANTLVTNAQAQVARANNEVDTLTASITSAIEDGVDRTLSRDGVPADAAACGDLKNAFETVFLPEVFDFSIVTKSHINITANGKYDSNATQETYCIDLSRVTKVTIDTLEDDGTIISFLNTYNPVVGTRADFASRHNARIAIEKNSHAEYLVSGNMNYLYVLLKTTGGINVTPVVNLYFSTDTTLMKSHVPADAKATGDNIAKNKELVDDLRSVIDTLNGEHTIYPTQFDTALSANGVTVKYESGRIKAYGVSLGTRYITIFNSKVEVCWSTSEFKNTFSSGIYRLHISASGYAADVFRNVLYYTTTIFRDFTTVSDDDLIIVSSPIMVGLALIKDIDFGTIENPTYIDVSLERIVEKADVEYVDSAFDSAFDDSECITYTDFKDGYIDTSGNSISLTPIPSDRYKHIIIPCEAGEKFTLQTRGGDKAARYYSWCDSEYNIIYKFNSFALAQTYSWPWFAYNKHRIAPAHAAYLIVNHRIDLSDGGVNIQGYNPKVYKLPKSDYAEHIARRMTGELPYVAQNEWEYMVVATYKSMIVILDYSSKYLKLSRDCGRTWNSGVDVSDVGQIQTYHLFNNGCLTFFTATKAYYIEDWQSYNESICYEQDGETVFTPQVDKNFNGLWDHSERKFIGNQDMYVFSNYNLERDGYRRLMWYSIDNGHTYKIAYEFSLPETYEARHIHEVIYYEPRDVFIVTTGDSNATECRVIEFKYNESNDSWSATVLAGPHRDYKWACIAIWAEKIYYTYDSTPGKVMACDYDDIADVSKHETLLSDMECDSLSLGFSLTGELIVIQSTARSTAGQTIPIGMTPQEATRKVYYSSDRKNFVSVIIPINFINGMANQSRIKPITTDGHCYIGQPYNSGIPSLRIDDYLHYCGYKNAFKPF